MKNFDNSKTTTKPLEIVWTIQNCIIVQRRLSDYLPYKMIFKKYPPKMLFVYVLDFELYLKYFLGELTGAFHSKFTLYKSSYKFSHFWGVSTAFPMNLTPLGDNECPL